MPIPDKREAARQWRRHWIQRVLSPGVLRARIGLAGFTLVVAALSYKLAIQLSQPQIHTQPPSAVVMPIDSQKRGGRGARGTDSGLVHPDTSIGDEVGAAGDSAVVALAALKEVVGQFWADVERRLRNPDSMVFLDAAQSLRDAEQAVASFQAAPSILISADSLRAATLTRLREVVARCAAENEGLRRAGESAVPCPPPVAK
jgi:hypothetical protein